MTPARLSRTVLHAVRRAAADGELGTVRASTGPPQRVTVESPPRRGPGDYAVNVAFRLAGSAGMATYEIARVLRARLLDEDGVADVRITGGGFLNVTLDARARAALVAELAQGATQATGREQTAPGETAPGETAPGETATRTADHRGTGDRPAADIARWSAATGDDPAALVVRTAAANPLFRVQYAHARTRRLADNARELGLSADPYAEWAEVSPAGADPYAEWAEVSPAGADPYAPSPEASLREASPAETTPAETSPSEAAPEVAAPPALSSAAPAAPAASALLALLADHRRVSEQGDAGRHARHLVAVADAFFDFHDQCPPLPRGDEKPGAAHRARLALVEAAGTVLAGGLTLLGVSAPAHL